MTPAGQPSVTFTDASATAGGHTGSISDPSWTVQQVDLSPASDTPFPDAGTGLGGTGIGTGLGLQSTGGASAGDVVGLVEIMKSFHEVQSDAEGRVVRFLVENEDLVDAGQAIIELG